MNATGALITAGPSSTACSIDAGASHVLVMAHAGADRCIGQPVASCAGIWQ